MSKLTDNATKAVKFFDKTIEGLGVKEKYHEIVGDIPDDEIIYLTGMSINKKTFHAIYNLISDDNEYDNSINFTKETFENLYKYINRIDNKKKESFVEKVGKNVAVTTADSAVKKWIEFLSEETLKESLKSVFPFVTIVQIGLEIIDSIKSEEANKAQLNLDKSIFAKELLELILSEENNLISELSKLKWDDFFAIFQSNQSDSRGVSSICSGQKNAFVLNYGYSDKPFYENLFINSLSIKFNNDKFHHHKIDIHALYKLAYQEHALDIVGAKILRNSIFEASKKAYQGDISELYSKEAEKSVKDALTNRNLFGIDLLSRFLFYLVRQLEFKEREEYKKHVKNQETAKKYAFQTIKVYARDIIRINEKNHQTNLKDFTKELFEYGSCPISFEFTDNANDADLVIDIEYLHKDSFISNEDTVNISDDRLIIPIKYFIALPIYLDEEGEEIPTRAIYVPERLVHDVRDDGSMNVYTVGGIEHNRPLMRLVNIHRQQKENKRQLGFFDNHFDYYHKFKNLRNSNYKHYFLMGANQLVSGLNEYHYERLDNNEGNSISTVAKLIYFNLNDEKSRFFNNERDLTWNIISVYGFSALASAYATLWTIINIKYFLENPDKYVVSQTKERAFTNSLAFKALHLQSGDELNDCMNVFTRRIKFQERDKMDF